MAPASAQPVTPPAESAPLPFDLLVCGPIWVDYILYLSASVQIGAACAIEAEVREAGGWGWQVARMAAESGLRVALWSNPVVEDANGRVFRRALEELPQLQLMSSAPAEGETPYCVTLRTPTSNAFFAATRLWRNQAGTRVPYSMSEALPAARAALYIGQDASVKPWLLQWRESRITVTETFQAQGQDDPTTVQDAVQWAHQALS